MARLDRSLAASTPIRRRPAISMKLRPATRWGTHASRRVTGSRSRACSTSRASIDPAFAPAREGGDCALVAILRSPGRRFVPRAPRGRAPMPPANVTRDLEQPWAHRQRRLVSVSQPMELEEGLLDEIRCNRSVAYGHREVAPHVRRECHVQSLEALNLAALVRDPQPTMTVYSPHGHNTGAAVVVFRGGGYNILAIDLEGTEVCDWLTSKGITCVLLKYRVPCVKVGPYRDCRTALEDAQRPDQRRGFAAYPPR